MMIQSWKSNGQWITHVCTGTFDGNQIRFTAELF
jgi:hypothetical protein